MSRKQRTLWLLAALSAPLAHFSGCGWFAALLAALVVLPITCIPTDWEGMSRPHAILQILWLGAVAGTLLRGSSAYWPSNNDLVVPLTLIALAAFTGPSAAPRVGAVLAFCLLVLSVPVAVSGASKLEPDWLRPAIDRWPMGMTLALLLPILPASGARGRGKRALSIAAVALALSFLTQGVLSYGVASAVPDPLYQTGRTLGRLEPVTAAAMTLGWYALALHLFCSASGIARGSGLGEKMATVLVSGTSAAFVLFPQQLDQPTLAVFSAVLWVLIPFFRKNLNFKKSEKSA